MIIVLGSGEFLRPSIANVLPLMVQVLLQSECSGGITKPIDLIEGVDFEALGVWSFLIVFLVQGLEPFLGKKDDGYAVGSGQSERNPINDVIVTLLLRCMDINGEEEVAEREDENGAFECLEGEPREFEVKVDRAGEPLEEVVLIHPVLKGEDEGEDDADVRGNVGVKGDNVDIHNVVSVLAGKVELGVLQSIIQLHLEHVHALLLPVVIPIHYVPQDRPRLQGVQHYLDDPTHGHQRSHIHDQPIVAEGQVVIVPEGDDVVDHGRIHELSEDCLYHERKDIVCLGLVLLEVSEPLYDQGKDEVYGDGEGGHDDCVEVVEEDLSVRLNLILMRRNRRFVQLYLEEEDEGEPQTQQHHQVRLHNRVPSSLVRNLHIEPIHVTWLSCRTDLQRLSIHSQSLNASQVLQKIFAVMLILERDVCFAYKMGEVECHRVISSEFLTQVNVLLIEALNLVGYIEERFLIILQSLVNILLMQLHQLLAHASQLFHLGEVKAQRHTHYLGTRLYLRILLQQFVKLLVELIRLALLLLYLRNPLVYLLFEQILQLVLILALQPNRLSVPTVLRRQEDGNILNEDGVIDLGAIGDVSYGVNFMLVPPIQHEEDHGSNNRHQIEDIDNIDHGLISV